MQVEELWNGAHWCTSIKAGCFPIGHNSKSLALAQPTLASTCDGCEGLDDGLRVFHSLIYLFTHGLDLYYSIW